MRGPGGGWSIWQRTARLLVYAILYGRMALAGGASHMSLCVRDLTAVLIVSAAHSGPASWRVRSMLRDWSQGRRGSLLAV